MGENAFKPYEKDSKGEFGLGLSIVKSYAKLLNQEYGVENKFNGVEFYITTEISQN